MGTKEAGSPVAQLITVVVRVLICAVGIVMMVKREPWFSTKPRLRRFAENVVFNLPKVP